MLFKRLGRLVRKNQLEKSITAVRHVEKRWEMDKKESGQLSLLVRIFAFKKNRQTPPFSNVGPLVPVRLRGFSNGSLQTISINRMHGSYRHASVRFWS
ncbi:hypothetical protein NPIL_43131 [Nephila pilipes]|uniref:Uncharacterized protein n=1 Tax=Nephila pilipes TaxID=299642 RepID=A0A8X6N223_NEPPI|nr:hypothetical protein NPIL_393531 [Nephila pilipes]GFU33917.1 hypothetical protein NPIL_43131 [Nephila pilipes]